MGIKQNYSVIVHEKRKQVYHSEFLIGGIMKKSLLVLLVLVLAASMCFAAGGQDVNYVFNNGNKTPIFSVLLFFN